MLAAEFSASNARADLLQDAGFIGTAPAPHYFAILEARYLHATGADFFVCSWYTHKVSFMSTGYCIGDGHVVFVGNHVIYRYLQIREG